MRLYWTTSLLSILFSSFAVAQPADDINMMTSQQWAGRVTAAKEGMRQIYGVMTPEDEKAFNASWAPAFAFPCQQVMDYLEKLNPRITRFLAARGAYNEALVAYDAARYHALQAAGRNDDDAIVAGMAEANTHKNTLVALAATLKQIADEVAALGPVPDAQELQKKARRRHNRALALLKPASLDGLWTFSKRTRYNIYAAPSSDRLALMTAASRKVVSDGMLREVENKEIEGGLFIKSVTTSDDGLVFAFVGTKTLYDELADAEDKETRLGVKAPEGGIVGKIRFIDDQFVIFEDLGNGNWIEASLAPLGRRTLLKLDGDFIMRNTYTRPSDYVVGGNLVEEAERSTDGVMITFTKTWEQIAAYGLERVQERFENYRTWRTKETAIREKLFAGPPDVQAYKQAYYEMNSEEFRRYEVQQNDKIAKEKERLAALSETDFRRKGIVRTIEQMEFQLGVNRKDAAERLKKELAERYPDTVDVEVSAGPRFASQPDEKQPEPPEPVERDQRQLLIEQRKFHDANIGYFRQQLDNLKNKLNQSRDAVSRQKLQWEILAAEANMQSEQDQLKALGSEQPPVRTRTRWDNYNEGLMAKRGRDEAREWNARFKKIDRMERLIQQADPEDRDRLHDAWQRNLSKNLATGNFDKVDEAAKAIFDTVQGGNEAEAARQEEAAINADESLSFAQNVKTVSDVSLAFLTIVGTAGGGGTVMFRTLTAEGLISTAYQTTTGYIEGGLAEGFKQLATSYSDAAQVFSIAMDAYQQSVLDAYQEHAENPDQIQIDESSAGLTGMVWALGKEAVKFAFMKTVIEPGAVGLRDRLKLNKYPKSNVSPVNWVDHKTQIYRRRSDGTVIPRADTGGVNWPQSHPIKTTADIKRLSSKIRKDAGTGEPVLDIDDALNIPATTVRQMKSDSPALYQAYRNTMNKRLDTTTPADKAVFWSGGAGRVAAENSGATTLADTTGGKFAINNAGKRAFWEEQKTYYVPLSKKMAQDASGEVHAYLENGITPDSIFAQHELPVLMSNKKVTKIILHEGDGAGGWKTRQIGKTVKPAPVPKPHVAGFDWNEPLQTDVWPTAGQVLGYDSFQASHSNALAKTNLFKSRIADYRRARAAGATGGTLAAIRADAEAAYKLIKTDSLCNNLLKEASGYDTATTIAYHQFDLLHTQRISERLAELYKEAGLPPQEVVVVDNARQDSEGTNVELALSQPAKWIGSGDHARLNPAYLSWRETLSRTGSDGTPVQMTVDEFEKISQDLLARARTEVLGQTEDKALRSFVLLGNPPPVAQESADPEPTMDPAWVKETTDGATFKLSTLDPKHASRAVYATLQKQCADLAQDLDEKVFKGNVLAKATPETKAHFEALHRLMADFSHDRIGPIDTDRQLRLLSGGKGVVEVSRQMAALLQVAASKEGEGN